MAENAFVAAQLKGQLKVIKNGYLIAKVAAAQQADKIKNIMSAHTMWGTEVGAAYQTLLGPISADLGWSNRTKEFRFYISLGHTF